MVFEGLRGGVKYSEKVLCKGSGTLSFFIDGDDIFFLRKAGTLDVGSMCAVDDMETEGELRAAEKKRRLIFAALPSKRQPPCPWIFVSQSVGITKADCVVYGYIDYDAIQRYNSCFN